jgi:hypothetical protein
MSAETLGAKKMKNVIKVALLATTFAASSTAFAGQPVGAAMVSSKVSHQTATATANAAGAEVAATQIKSFQWGSTPARTNAANERVVKTQSFEAKPSVITWPSSAGTIKDRGPSKKD